MLELVTIAHSSRVMYQLDALILLGTHDYSFARYFLLNVHTVTRRHIFKFTRNAAKSMAFPCMLVPCRRAQAGWVLTGRHTSFRVVTIINPHYRQRTLDGNLVPKPPVFTKGGLMDYILALIVSEDDVSGSLSYHRDINLLYYRLSNSWIRSHSVISWSIYVQVFVRATFPIVPRRTMRSWSVLDWWLIGSMISCRYVVAFDAIFSFYC